MENGLPNKVGGARATLVTLLLALLASCTSNDSKQAAEKVPYDATLAIAAQQGQDYDEAIRLWTQVISDSTISTETRARAYWGRGVSYWRKKDLDRAIDDANRSIDLKNDLPETHALRGGLYGLKGHYEDSIVDFDAALKLKPDMAEALGGRGDAHRLRGEFDLAIADYDATIRAKPYLADAYIGRALSNLQIGKTDQAISDTDEAIRRAPKNPDAFRTRGLVLYQMRRMSDAASSFRQGLSLKPDEADLVLFIHLTQVWLKTSDTTEFSANLGKLSPSQSNDPLVAYLQGKRKVAEILASTDPDSSETAKQGRCVTRFYIGANEAAIGKTDNARQMLQNALRDCPIAAAERTLAKLELGHL